MKELEPDSKKKTEMRPENHPEYGKWRLNLGVLAISGASSVGKSTFVEWVTKIYGIPNQNKIEIGKIVREVGQVDQTTTKYIPENLDVDWAINDMQKNILASASTPTQNNPTTILESRFVGVITEKVKRENPNISVKTILIKASMEERLNRLQKRNPESSREDLEKDVRERDLLDRTRLKDTDSKFEDHFDERYFDFVIDSSGKNPKEVFEVLHEWLLKNGYISKKEGVKNIPAGGQIFPNPSA